MDIKIRRYAGGQHAAAAAGAIEEIHVPTGLLALLSALAGLLPALATVGTLWFVTKPNADQARGIEMARYQLEVVQRSLQVEDPEGRRTSLRLLRELGMLHTGNNRNVDSMLRRGSIDTLPLWRPVVSSNPAQRNTSQRSAADSRTPAERAVPDARGSGRQRGCIKPPPCQLARRGAF